MSTPTSCGTIALGRIIPSRGRSTAAASGIRNPIHTSRSHSGWPCALTPRQFHGNEVFDTFRERSGTWASRDGGRIFPGYCTDRHPETPLETVSQVQQFEVQLSNVYYVHKLRNTLIRQSRSFWSKLQHGTNAAWNAFILTEIHIVIFYYP